MEALELIYSLTSLLCLLSLSVAFLLLCKIPWLRHLKIYRILKSQGIDGPPPSFFNGNLEEMRSLTLKAKKSATTQSGGEDQSTTEDYAKTLFPYLHKWRKNYGPTFTFWIGKHPVICVSQPDLVREISRRVSFDLGKGTHFQKIQEPLFGRGIIKSNGAEWAHQRKTIAPELFLNKVKGMVELMVESTIPLLNSWDAMIEHEGATAEIVVDEYFRNFSADVISRACFGGSYSKGKEIFTKLRALSRVIAERRMHFDFPSWIKYIETYKQPIEMLPSKEEWMKVNLPYEVGPPHTKRPRGRPKKVRMRGEDEHGKNKTSKQQHQCQRCGGWGHHRNTCKNPINSQIVIQGAKRGRGRGRGRGRERQESILQTSEGIDYDAPIGETSEEPIQNTVEVRGSRRARGGVRGRGRSSTTVEAVPSGQVEGVSSQLQSSDFDWDFDFLLDGTSSATIPEPPVGSVDTTSTFMNSWDISNYQITSISPNEATSPLKTKTKRKPLRGGKK